MKKLRYICYSLVVVSLVLFSTCNKVDSDYMQKAPVLSFGVAQESELVKTLQKELHYATEITVEIPNVYTIDEITRVLQSFTYLNPQYIWMPLEYKYTTTETKQILSIKPSIEKRIYQEQKALLEDSLYAVCTELMSMDVKQQISELYLYLQGTVYSNDAGNTMYDNVVLHSSNCQGAAYAFSYICTQLEIENGLVFGIFIDDETSNISENNKASTYLDATHVWNYIIVDNTKWYIDVCNAQYLMSLEELSAKRYYIIEQFEVK